MPDYKIGDRVRIAIPDDLKCSEDWCSWYFTLTGTYDTTIATITYISDNAIGFNGTFWSFYPKFIVSKVPVNPFKEV